MATARMTVPAPIGLDDDSNSYALSCSLPNAAGTSVVDAYATRILKSKSPPEVCVDDSLGPYITSLLRHSLEDSPGFSSDIASIPEYESLMELLEEHCCLDAEAALGVLQTIATAVKTGVVEARESSVGGGHFDSPWSSSLGPKKDNSMEPLSLLGDVLKGADDTVGDLAAPDLSVSSQQPQKIASDQATFPLKIRGGNEERGTPFQDRINTDDPSASSGTTGGTPLKPDRLIPVDLMGVLDDPSTPTGANGKYTISSFEVPPPQSISADSVKTDSGGKNKKDEADDLAASLFRPARVRQNSIDEEAKSPRLRAMSGTFSGVPQAPLDPSAGSYYEYEPNHGSLFYQQQLDSAVEILLSMNNDLGEEAAVEAALIAHTDVNVAQYVIDGACAAPPVCRHMLNDGCYRSDCQFSHDVEGHTCLFWLRGRCGKGDSCRFLHGYSEKLLEGMNTDLLPEQYNEGEGDDVEYHGTTLNGSALSSRVKSEPLPIKTTNLVQHNADQAFSAPQHAGRPFAFMSSASGIDSSAFTFPPQTHTGSRPISSWDLSPLELTKKSGVEERKSQSGLGSAISFASIATKGYDNASFSSGSPSKGIGGALAASASAGQEIPQKSKSVRIPQDLWNPHHNRSASMFHIADPLERYREVSSSVTRSDVIDLHFQSTKTFQEVLAAVLPDKLRVHKEVWVVTGTGHHVSKNTHQRGGGALESAVSSWLVSEGYTYAQGRDRNGHGGALLVKR